MAVPSPTCPHCGGAAAVFRQKAAQWECRDCERRFDAVAEGPGAPPPPVAWTFPALEHPAVFIAAPGDVEYLRQAARLEFEGLVGRVADHHGVQVYDYRDQAGEVGFEDWRPAQGQIPLPSDPNCRAVVCVFGERIGTPLPHDFDVSALAPLDAYRANGARLVHPWVEGAEEQGGFALTGTTFEYLAACRSNELGGAPPVLLLLVGDDTIREQTDPMCANWGGGRHLEHMAAEHVRKYGVRARREQSQWEQARYYPQIAQLINFRRYLEGRGQVPKYVADEPQARERIREFLRGALDLTVRDAARMPFKGLEAYGQDDRSVFFGREAERAEAVADLTQLWSNRSRPTFFGVIGGSGVGKSSFARTALVGHLCHHTSDGRYVGCVMRPADLLAEEAGAGVGGDGDASPEPLRRLYVLALAQLDPGADPGAALADFGLIVPAARPDWVLGRLVAALRARGPEWRLLLAFDQFEELLDQRTQPDGEALWAPVVELIERAVMHEAVGVVYTLQTNREDLISHDTRLGPLWARGGQLPLAFPLHSLDRIIREPFSVAQGIEVEPGLVVELRRRILAFAERCDSRTQGSLLPLVSLTLTRIFNECHGAVLARAESPAEPAARVDPPEVAPPTLLLSDCEHLLDVEGAIAHLADEAVAEASGGAGAGWSDDAVGSLLRRLVRANGSDRLELPVAALPAQGAVRRLAEALVRRRLLVPEPDGRVRLVHEAVFRHWARAAEWLEGEQRILRLVGALGYRVEDWRSAGADALASASVRDVDEAAEVLVQWFDVLADDGAREVDVGLAGLRDYAMALLEAHPMPSRVVAASPQQVRHVHVAATYGELGLLRRYIEVDAQCVHAQRKDGRTPLFPPVFDAQFDLIECLLEAGARADVADVDGWQPVHAAASSGRWDVVERLCAAGADVCAVGGPWRNTALHLAAMYGHLDVLRGLLARPDCDPGAESRYGWTPMHLAAQEGRSEALRLLHASGRASLEAKLENGWTPLHSAASEGRAEAVRVLLELGADPQARANNDFSSADERGKRPPDQQWHKRAWTPLHLAVSARHVDAVAALLQGGADVDAVTEDGDTPPKLAIASGDEALLRVVVAAGPDLSGRDDRGRTPLQALVMQGRFDLAAALPTADVDIDAPLGDGTLLHAVVREGDEAQLRFLLQRGAGVDRRCAGERTALHLACDAGRLALVRLLVESGANPAAVDELGRTPLHEAATAAQLAVLEWLVGQGADLLDASDADAATALHLSAQWGRDDAVQRLLAAGARPDPRDADGWTPLMLAAQGGHARVVSGLIDAGAEPDALAVRPAMGALQAAAEGGHDEVVAALLAHGARIDVASPDKPPAVLLALRNGRFATALRLLDAGAAVPAEPSVRSDLVASIKARQQRLATLGEPVPAEGFDLLARLGGDDPVLWRAFLGGISLQPALAALAQAGPVDAPSVVRGIMHYPWAPATAQDRLDLVGAMNPLDGRWAVGDQSVVQAVGLPWYADDMLLMRVMDEGWNQPGLAIHYLRLRVGSKVRYFRLDGSSAPIHDANEAASFRLDASNVMGYLKFFCFFVRGDEGPFHVLESLDDPLIPRDASGQVIEVLRNTIRPAAFDGMDDEGQFRCSAVVWYGNAVFVAMFAILPNGVVDMTDDEPIAANLPARIHAPI